MMNSKSNLTPVKTSMLVFGVILIAAMALQGFLFKTFFKKPTPIVRSSASYQFPYNLSSPNDRQKLPGKLQEISGLAYWDKDEVLAIQDEIAKVFVYNLAQEEIVRSVDFGKDLDYEGITRIDNTVYVLESDGDIHYFTMPSAGVKKVDAGKFESKFNTSHDTEGLCYDPFTQRLLIVPKEEQLAPKEGFKKHKGIYAFNPATGMLDENPLWSIDPKELGQIIYGEERSYHFKPSGIAVHPNGQHIYVISSVGKLLIVLDRKGEIQYLERLDDDLFSQPEGITFTPAAELIISSEGRSKSGKILRFTPLSNE